MNVNKEYAQMLLDEIKEICRTNNIDYKLVWGPEEIGAGIMMNAGGCRMLMEILDGFEMENRAVESWLNSETYPDDTVRYIGTDSLCYNILDYDNYNNHGIFIEINVARANDDSMSGKKSRALISSLKREAYSFTLRGEAKHGWIREHIYNRAIKKSGSIGNLKRKVFEDVVLSAEDISLESKEAADFKFRKYTKDYLANCIVESDIDGKEIFSDEEFTSVLADDLNDMRELRDKIEIHKARGKANNKKAENVWNTVLEIDRKFKAEENEDNTAEAELSDDKGAEES